MEYQTKVGPSDFSEDGYKGSLGGCCCVSFGNIWNVGEVERGACLNNVIDSHGWPQKFKDDGLPDRDLVWAEEKQVGSIFFSATDSAGWCVGHVEVVEQPSGRDGLSDESIYDIALDKCQ